MIMSGAVTQAGVSAQAKVQGRRSSLTRSRVRAAWLFIAPSLVVVALIAGWPLARTIWFSFTDASLNNLSDYEFIGFENYLANYDGEWFGILTEPDWWHSVWNTLWFTLVSVSIETVLGIVVALILNAAFPGRGIMRAIILIPWAIPTIVSAKMWNWMLHDQFGVINDLLQRLGIIAAPISWTANSQTALWAVVAVDVWKTTPFMALLILAALQTLPRDCYEAARVDGVHPLRLFFKVTLPLIKHPLMVAVVFRLLDALRIFDLIYVLTSNSSSTISMSGFVRREMVDNGNMGYGSAASTSLFLMILVSAVLFLRLARVRWTEPPR